MIDWLLSISIVSGACKAESLLKSAGNTLESDLITTLRKQLKTVAYYFLGLNSLYALLLIVSTAYDNKKYCFNECAEPNHLNGGLFLGLKEILRLLSIEFYLYAFWYLPNHLTTRRDTMIDIGGVDRSITVNASLESIDNFDSTAASKSPI